MNNEFLITEEIINEVYRRFCESCNYASSETNVNVCNHDFNSKHDTSLNELCDFCFKKIRKCIIKGIYNTDDYSSFICEKEEDLKSCFRELLEFTKEKNMSFEEIMLIINNDDKSCYENRSNIIDEIISILYNNLI